MVKEKMSIGKAEALRFSFCFLRDIINTCKIM